MAKVILYNPREKAALKVPYLPFSIMTVGSALQAAGFEVNIVDARVNPKAQETVAALLEDDVLFFGMTLCSGSGIYDGLKMLRLVKTRRPGLTTVLGGVHCSLLPEQTVEHPDVDIVAIGPGERIAVDIARAITHGRDISKVPNIAYKKEGRATINHHNILQHLLPDTAINYELVDLRQYIKADASGKRCLDYLSSRGCPHPCTYCAISKIWKEKIFYYSPQKMVDDLEHFQNELQIDSVHFLDDNFFVNRRRVEAFCDEVLKRKLSLRFWSMCRIQYFAQYDDAFLLKLKRAGFRTMNFGAESGSQAILDRIKKGAHAEQILETARRCNQYGFRGQFSFMMGFPFETDADLEKTLLLIDHLHAINPNFDMQLFPFIPFPQTEITEECQRLGYVPPAHFEEWARFEYGVIVMPWLSAKMKKRIAAMATIAWFAFTSETAIKLGGIKGWLFSLLGKLARLRWRLRFFDFPLEWRLINFLARQ